LVDVPASDLRPPTQGYLRLRQLHLTRRASAKPFRPTLIEEVAAWEDRRNRHHSKADWQFTTADARVKLKRLYPAI
jgi:hypothetical protein